MTTRVLKKIRLGYDEELLKTYGIDKRLPYVSRSFVIETDDTIYVIKVNGTYDVIDNDGQMTASATTWLYDTDFEIMESFRFYSFAEMFAQCEKDILYVHKSLSNNK